MYRNLGLGIEVELEETDYVVKAFANWNNEIKKYSVGMILGHKKLDLLKDLDNEAVIECDKKEVKTTLNKLVTDLHNQDDFAQDIKEYEYTLLAAVEYIRKAGDK